MKYLRFFKNVLNSSTIQFVAVRYISYGLTFLNSLLLANYLGDYVFGLYGFVLLFLQYFAFSNFGINHSLNTILAVKKGNKRLSEDIWGTSLLISILISILFLAINFILLSIFPNILSKYEYARYGTLVVFLGLVINFNNLFLAINRIYSRFQIINFQLLSPQIGILILLLWGGNITIETIVLVMLSANILSLILFVYKSPLKIRLKFSKILMLNLISRGVSLILYNMSYSFIIISSATIVSIFYKVNVFGQYKFAQTISSAIFMAAGAFSFVFFPKIINRMVTKKKDEVVVFIREMREVYIGALNLLSFIFLLFIPAIDRYFPEYSDMLNVFKLLLLAQVLSNQSNVYKTYLIAKKKEKYLTYYGFSAIAIVVLLGISFCSFGLPYEYVALSVVVGVGYYSFMSIRKTLLLLGENVIKNLKDILAYKLLIPLLIVVISVLLEENIILPIIALFVHLLLNIKEIGIILKGFVRIVNDNKIVEI